MVEVLINDQADVNIQDKVITLIYSCGCACVLPLQSEKTPLHYATEIGDCDIMELLFENKCALEAKDMVSQ